MSHAKKTLHLHFAAVLLALICLLPSCGGGGGGVGGGDDTVSLPDEFNYSLAVDSQDPFTMSDSKGDDVTLGTLGPVTGTYVTGSRECSLKKGSLINATREGWASPYHAFTIQILTDIVATAGQNPTQGSWKVTDGNPNTVDLSVIASPSQGVSISLNNGAARTYTWDELYALYLDENEEYWRWQASLSAIIISKLLDEVVFSADTLTEIETNDTTLEEDGSLAFTCSAFPGSTPPSGVPVLQGTNTLGWVDTSGDSALGPGDDFTWTYYWCWADDPSNDIDLLYLGSVSMLGFLENSADDTIASIGFMPEGDSAGGVFYDGFLIYTTEETSQGVVEVETGDYLVYNGGYSIMFYTE